MCGVPHRCCRRLVVAPGCGQLKRVAGGEGGAPKGGGATVRHGEGFFRGGPALQSHLVYTVDSHTG